MERANNRSVAVAMAIEKRLPVPLVAMLIVTASAALAQQGASNPQAVDKIIGTEVEEEETQASAEPEKVIAAIDKTLENTEIVRKTSNLAKVDIVFLPDAARAEGGPPPEIEAKVKEHEPEIAELRKEIEGNAMLFHAIDSRRILPQDVLGVEFDAANGVVIYVAAKPTK